MIYLTWEEAYKSGHTSFWRIGFDYQTDEGSVVYLDRDSNPNIVEACKLVRQELGEPTFSYPRITVKASARRRSIRQVSSRFG